MGKFTMGRLTFEPVDHDPFAQPAGMGGPSLNAYRAPYEQLPPWSGTPVPRELRKGPTPSFVPTEQFRDDIFAAPPEGTRSLDFDRMDMNEQGKWPDADVTLRQWNDLLRRGPK